MMNQAGPDRALTYGSPTGLIFLMNMIYFKTSPTLTASSFPTPSSEVASTTRPLVALADAGTIL